MGGETEQLVSARQRDQFERDGYLVIEDPGVPAATFDAIVAELEDRYMRDVRIYLDENGVLYSGGPEPRIRDAWKISESVRSLALAPTVLGILEELYGRKPLPFQTLNFPIGTQQAAHSDVVHFDSDLQGYMCGVWFALEDIDMDNGPLLYFPGSHKLPETRWEEVGVQLEESDVDEPGDLPRARNDLYERHVAKIVDRMGLTPHFATLAKGQALVWASNLLHGGAPQRDKGRSRHSQVTHYFFEGSSRYHTPMLNVRGEPNYWEPTWVA